MTKAEKKVITPEEFEKRVEMEADSLQYFDRMRKGEAFEKAREEISSRFVSSEK